MQEEPIKEQRSRDTDSLRAACEREGCPVCTVVLEYLERSIDNWEYEGFSDVQHRYELIHSRGFCPLHTWQLAQRSNGFRPSLKPLLRCANCQVCKGQKPREWMSS